MCWCVFLWRPRWTVFYQTQWASAEAQTKKRPGGGEVIFVISFHSVFQFIVTVLSCQRKRSKELHNCISIHLSIFCGRCLSFTEGDHCGGLQPIPAVRRQAATWTGHQFITEMTYRDKRPQSYIHLGQFRVSPAFLKLWEETKYGCTHTFWVCLLYHRLLLELQ